MKKNGALATDAELKQNFRENFFWSPKFPRIRRVKFDKPVKLSAQFYEIEKMLGTLETKLDPVDSFELREFYRKRTKDFDLCPDCRRAFEEFMKNER